MVIPEKAQKKSPYHIFFCIFFKKKIKKQHHSITIFFLKKPSLPQKKHGSLLMNILKFGKYNPYFFNKY